MSVDFAKCVAADLNRLPTSPLVDRETSSATSEGHEVTNGHWQSTSDGKPDSSTNSSFSDTNLEIDANNSSTHLSDIKSFMDYEVCEKALVVFLLYFLCMIYAEQVSIWYVNIYIYNQCINVNIEFLKCSM